MFIKKCTRRGAHLLFSIISSQYSPGGLGNRTRVCSHLFGTGRQRPPWPQSPCPPPQQSTRTVPTAVSSDSGGRPPALLIPPAGVTDGEQDGQGGTGHWSSGRDPIPGGHGGVGTSAPRGPCHPPADPRSTGAAGGSEKREKERRGHKVFKPSLAPRKNEPLSSRKITGMHIYTFLIPYLKSLAVFRQGRGRTGR